MKIMIIGIGWETSLIGKIEGDKITFNKKEFDEMIDLVAYTHDTVSGGFRVEYTE